MYFLILPFCSFICLQTLIYSYVTSIKDTNYTTILIDCQMYVSSHLSCKSRCYEFFHYIKLFVYFLILPFCSFICLQTLIYSYVTSIKDTNFTTILIDCQMYVSSHLSCKSRGYEFFHYALTGIFCPFTSAISELLFYQSTVYFFTVLPTRLF